MSVKISIILPFYNAETYLSDCIESILAQTFTDFELLAINDGSIDGSANVVKKFNDKRIQLITLENNFVESLNYGLTISNGKYIVRMDADDLMFPKRLEIQYEFMERYSEIDLCGSWAESFGEVVKIMQYEHSHEAIISSMLLYNCIIHPTVIIRKSTVLNLKLKYKDYSYADDYKFWTDFALSGARFANIPQPLIYYRTSSNQLTNKYWDNMSFASNKIRLEYAEGIINRMIEDDERYLSLMEQIIYLFEVDLLNFELFTRMLYHLFKNHLEINKSFLNN